jgi:hypothetical protein
LANKNTQQRVKKMEDVIENKEAIYGRYEDQAIAVAKIVAALDELRRTVSKGDKGLSNEENVDYTILALKLTRSVTARGESAKDSWLDLANYSRLVCRRRVGVDIAKDFRIIAEAATPKLDMRDIKIGDREHAAAQ